MSLDNLNKWLPLSANIGVLVGIFVVAIELNQTQIALQADSSAQRAAFAANNATINFEMGISEVASKVNSNEALTDEELQRARNWSVHLLRFFENLHYQNELGVLDVEIYEANINGLTATCRGPVFQTVYPDWPEGFFPSTFRTSFRSLVTELCFM